MGSPTMNTFAIVRNTVDIFKIDWELDFLKDEERKAYYEAFSAFDWNDNGKISTGVLIFALRRAGLNPTESEVHDVLNRLEDGSGVITFEEFCEVMLRKTKDVDQEIYYKQAFRVFYKDSSGCVPAQELKFVLSNLMISEEEIEEMILKVDKNGDGKISEFRVMLGAIPLLIMD